MTWQLWGFGGKFWLGLQREGKALLVPRDYLTRLDARWAGGRGDSIEFAKSGWGWESGASSQHIFLGLPQMFSTDKFKDLIFQPQRVYRLVSDPFKAA